MSDRSTPATTARTTGPAAPPTAEIGTATLLTPQVRAISRRVLLRFVPFLALVYVFNFLDRVAISYAGPNGLATDLSLTATAFGVASGLYFISSITLAVPIQYFVTKVGLPLWMTVMCVGWGITEALTAFVPDEGWLYFARIMLGVFESGFIPAVLVFLRSWLPGQPRGTAYSIFNSGASAASVVGGPLCVSLITLGASVQTALPGWSFMFLVVGIASVLLAIAMPFVLTPHVKTAAWLPEADRTALADQLQREDELASEDKPKFSAAFRSGRLWVIVIAEIAITFGSYTIQFFAPSIIGQIGKTATPFEVSLLSSLPAITGLVSLIVVGIAIGRGVRLSRIFPVALGLGLIGTILIWTSSSNLLISMVGLSMIGLVAGCVPAGYTLTSRMFSAGAAAAALTLYLALGNAGGFIGPYVTGAIEDATGSATLVFPVIGAAYIFAIVAFSVVTRWHERKVRDQLRAFPVGGEVGPTVVEGPATVA
jgi:MFS family permease